MSSPEGFHLLGRRPLAATVLGAMTCGEETAQVLKDIAVPAWYAAVCEGERLDSLASVQRWLLRQLQSKDTHRKNAFSEALAVFGVPVCCGVHQRCGCASYALAQAILLHSGLPTWQTDGLTGTSVADVYDQVVERVLGLLRAEPQLLTDSVIESYFQRVLYGIEVLEQIGTTGARQALLAAGIDDPAVVGTPELQERFESGDVHDNVAEAYNRLMLQPRVAASVACAALQAQWSAKLRGLYEEHWPQLVAAGARSSTPQVLTCTVGELRRAIQTAVQDPKAPKEHLRILEDLHFMLSGNYYWFRNGVKDQDPSKSYRYGGGMTLRRLLILRLVDEANLVVGWQGGPGSTPDDLLLTNTDRLRENLGFLPSREDIAAIPGILSRVQGLPFIRKRSGRGFESVPEINPFETVMGFYDTHGYLPRPVDLEGSIGQLEAALIQSGLAEDYTSWIKAISTSWNLPESQAPSSNEVVYQRLSDELATSQYSVRRISCEREYRDTPLLGGKSFDFFETYEVDDEKWEVFVEVDGAQHFVHVPRFVKNEEHAEQHLKKQRERDIMKALYAVQRDRDTGHTVMISIHHKLVRVLTPTMWAGILRLLVEQPSPWAYLRKEGCTELKAHPGSTMTLEDHPYQGVEVMVLRSLSKS